MGKTTKPSRVQKHDALCGKQTFGPDFVPCGCAERRSMPPLLPFLLALGETCNLLKKMRRGENVPKEDVANEIADVVIYLDLLAARLDIDLAGAVRRKFNKGDRG